MTLPNYVYVASSWRNSFHQVVVAIIRAVAHIDCYDYVPGSENTTKADFAAMQKADTFVLVLPCGRSAHLELGWAIGAGKRTAILLTEDEMVPEPMYKMVDHISPNMMDLLDWLEVED